MPSAQALTGTTKTAIEKPHPEVTLELESEEPTAIQQDQFSENPSIKMQSYETVGIVRFAVLSLPAELREALVLSSYEGLPQADIAKILGCSTKAVETRIYPARQLLRNMLQSYLK